MERKQINKILIFVFVFAIFLFGFLFFKKSPKSKIIYYYGQDCPHCAKVEEFLKENKVEEKIVFEKKEVYYNKKNAQELAERARKCQIQSKEIPVPFLWTGSECIIGDEAVINFFREKIK
jgi:glutaredoxin